MNHYNLIKSLIREIRDLRSEIDYTNESRVRQEEIFERRNTQLREQRDRIESQREMERQENLSRQWQREELMNKLDRQERYGDDWGASRTKRELKNLY